MASEGRDFFAEDEKEEENNKGDDERGEFFEKRDFSTGGRIAGEVEGELGRLGEKNGDGAGEEGKGEISERKGGGAGEREDADGGAAVAGGGGLRDWGRGGLFLGNGRGVLGVSKRECVVLHDVSIASLVGSVYNGGMKVLNEMIKKSELLQGEYVLEGPMVKGVVDVGRGLVGIDSDLHADIEQYFLGQGSRQDDLWGINLYPEEKGEDFIEFDSMINIRPRQGNKTRSVDDVETRRKIVEIVGRWVVND